MRFKSSSLLLCAVLGCTSTGGNQLGEPCSFEVSGLGVRTSDLCAPPLQCVGSRGSDGHGVGTCLLPCGAGCPSQCACGGSYCTAPASPSVCNGSVSCAFVPDGCGGWVSCQPCAGSNYCGGAVANECGVCGATCPLPNKATCQSACFRHSETCLKPMGWAGVCTSSCIFNELPKPNAGAIIDCIAKTCQDDCGKAGLDAGP
jgi:hypothetical protein